VRSENPDWDALGARLRAQRERQGIGVREMARRVGCSPGLISRLERGTVTPSVSTLYSITKELGVGLDQMLSTGAPARDDATPLYVLVRDGDRAEVPFASGVLWRLLAVPDGPTVECREILYPPGAMSTPPDEVLQHDGHEVGLVLAGSLGVSVNGDMVELGSGDSIAFESKLAHRFWNAGHDEVRAVWFIWSDTPSPRGHFHAPAQLRVASDTDLEVGL
jgi:transcriptional regulator with XRE-family HTH domain